MQRNFEEKNKMDKILGIGNALVDVLVQVEDELILSELNLPKGSMQLIDTKRYLEIQKRFASLHQQRTTGGSACNTILAIAHLGGEPGLIGKVGKDEPAAFFSANCQKYGIAAQLLEDSQLPLELPQLLLRQTANEPLELTWEQPPHFKLLTFAPNGLRVIPISTSKVTWCRITT